MALELAVQIPKQTARNIIFYLKYLLADETHLETLSQMELEHTLAVVKERLEQVS